MTDQAGRNEHPKLFISYCWTNREHEERVLKLATELRELGVDVILDKWDLKEGHDAHAFMEKMVTDSDVTKVLIVSDAAYAKKADARKGGVGTETYLISEEVYNKQEQNKFVAVVVERDSEGKACLPAYYKSRIYIDMCDESSYPAKFEELLRWVFDRPLHQKPELGNPPAFLNENAPISTGTSVLLKRALDALRGGSPNAEGATNEFLTTFTNNLERFRIGRTSDPYDQLVVDSIDALRAPRDEAIQLFLVAAQYAPTAEIVAILCRFFERLITYAWEPPNRSLWNSDDLDNYSFFAHELFLYAIAAFLNKERFDRVTELMDHRYYSRANVQYGRETLVDYTVLRKHMESLETRNNRLDLKRLSLRADIIAERVAGSGLEFPDILQADFILWARSRLQELGQFGWYPECLIYHRRQIGPFEIFARAASKKYFDRMKCILGIISPNGIDEFLSDNATKKLEYQFRGMDPASLSGRSRLSSLP